MIAIQILLVAAFLLILYKFLNAPASYRAKAWIKISTIIFTVVAVGAIIFPDSANSVAHFLGVGRGADLLLYLLTLSFIFTILHLYIKGKKTEQELTVLARKIALLQADHHLKSDK